MRWTFMKYKQCDCCGEKIRFWEDTILPGKNESHTAHRRCYLVHSNGLFNFSMLEVVNKSYKKTIDSLLKSLYDSYNERAALTANKSAVKKALRRKAQK